MSECLKLGECNYTEEAACSDGEDEAEDEDEDSEPEPNGEHLTKNEKQIRRADQRDVDDPAFDFGQGPDGAETECWVECQHLDRVRIIRCKKSDNGPTEVCPGMECHNCWKKLCAHPRPSSNDEEKAYLCLICNLTFCANCLPRT